MSAMTTTDVTRYEGPVLGPQDLLVTRLRPPVVRDHTVMRRRLFDALSPAPAIKLTVVAAPAGCGKSTLLATWHAAEAAHRPTAWVTLDEHDNDPVVLWRHVVEAFTRACPGVSQSVSSALLARASLEDVVLPRLVNELAAEDDVLLILDEFHRLSGPAVRSGVNWLVDHAPEGLQIVVASRTEPALNLGARRARGELQEVRAVDLGFGADEAEMLLNDNLGLGLDRVDVERLVERIEGWPAGLYLAALSLRGAEDRRAFLGRFGGTSRAVVDFLVDEVLDTYDADLQTMMLRCSVLDRLSGQLCDAVLDDEGAGEVLRELSRTNLFLRPLDDEGEWYRFHRVFAQLLRVELEHREPGLAATLHRRASSWYRAQGLVDDAIEHALKADAFDAARELIASTWVSYPNACRCEAMLGWLRRFPQQLKQQDAQLLTIEAWIRSLSGKPDAQEAIAAAQALATDGSLEASLATLRGALPYGDVGAGLASAQRAHDLDGPRAPVCWGLAIGHYFTGHADEADRWFAETIDRGPDSGQWVMTASALGYRSLIAAEQGRPDDQALLAGEASQLARERGVESIAGEALVAASVSQLGFGEAAAACSLAERGVESLRTLGQPTNLAFALIQQAKVLHELGDRDAAATAVTEARAIVDGCVDPGILAARVAALEASPRRQRAAAPAPQLSPRERSILRILTGPLSEREIGRELYLSHNTVHSHTRSIYRKLGASSRAEAISAARALGVL
jgi:LuxR family transcriptional regulator, maltose regulon positive regulatory protein